MLAGKGFNNIYNLSGGIKAWGREVAVGPEDSGMYLFAGSGTVKEAVTIGFGLEMGLRDFYLKMQGRASRQPVKQLLGQLADIEIIHQDQLLDLYRIESGDPTMTVKAFAETIVSPAMEGGLSTEDYLKRYDADLDSEMDILSLAMVIEAQALDLYLRAALKAEKNEIKKVFMKIAEEERAHITRLSRYLDQQEASS